MVRHYGCAEVAGVLRNRVNPGFACVVADWRVQGGLKPTRTLATTLTPDGRQLVLREHDGDFYLRVDEVPLMSTRQSMSEQYMAELACKALPSGARVLIGGLGFGFTLRRVLELVDTKDFVMVSELLPAMVDWNRSFLSHINGDLLDDPRVKVNLRDVFDVICTDQRGFEAILLDVDNSPDPLVDKGNARLYDSHGLALVRAALRPGGRVIYWSANRDDGFARLLRNVFEHVEVILAKSYPQAKKFTHTLFVAQ